MPLLSPLLALVRFKACIPTFKLQQVKYIYSIATKLSRGKGVFEFGQEKSVYDFETYEIFKDEEVPSFWESSKGLSQKTTSKKRSELFFELSQRLKEQRQRQGGQVRNGRDSDFIQPSASANLEERRILYKKEKLLDLLDSCLRIKEVQGSFNIYKKLTVLYPNSISTEHYSSLLFLFAHSIKKRNYNDDYRNRRVDRANHLESIPRYSSHYLKIVFCDMVKRGCFLEQEDWHSLFWGLSKDLDAASLEILWWILIARNHPKLARTWSYSPPENADLPIRGSEPAFGSVIITTSMANALLRVRSFTRGEFDDLVASDALAVAKARMTLEHMVILGIPRDESSYLNIISASHNHLRSDKAFLESINKILDELMAPNIQVKLTTDHCNRILVCLHQRGLFKMAKVLYQDLRDDPARSPNIESLNHILHVLIDSPEDEAIFDFYRQELERWNLKPDIVTLNILLEAQIQFGEVQGIALLLEEFRKNYFILPDKIAYTHIIRGFVSVGELQTAETYLKEYIDRQDIALAADPFHHLMRGYNERAQYDLLMDAYSVLIYAEIRIPMKIWRTLLISCIRQPNPTESIRLFTASCQKAHLGKWSMLLLEMVVETHIKACVEIDPVVAMVKESKLDSKTQHLALLTISSIYPKLARRPLPDHILEQLKPHLK